MRVLYDRHPHCELPSNLQAKIWRYCDLAKFVMTLERRALYFPSLPSLPDPFEGALTQPLARDLASRPDGPMIMHATREMRNCMYVNSWHLGEFESDAMWKRYATAGIAIQSTVNRLIQAFPPAQAHVDPLDPKVHIGLVKYCDYDTEDMPSENLMFAWLTKRRHFEHDRELRALVWLIKNYVSHDLPIGLSADVDLSVLVEQIYVAPDLPAYYVDAVGAVCRKFGLDKPVTPSRLYNKPSY